MMTMTARPVGRKECVRLLAALLTLLFTQTSHAGLVFVGGQQSAIDATARADAPFIWSGAHVSIRQVDLVALWEAGADGPNGFTLEAFVSKYLAAGLLTIEAPSPVQVVLATSEPTEVPAGSLLLVDNAGEAAGQPVPEPGTSTLLGIALVLAALFGKRR